MTAERAPRQRRTPPADLALYALAGRWELEASTVERMAAGRPLARPMAALLAEALRGCADDLLAQLEGRDALVKP
jgi:hypothetical protein